MRLALAVGHEQFALQTEMPAWVFWPVMFAILAGGMLLGRATDRGVIAEVAELREAERGLEAVASEADAELDTLGVAAIEALEPNLARDAEPPAFPASLPPPTRDPSAK